MTSPLQELGRVVAETADALDAPRAERDVERARARLVGAREGTVTLARDVAASQDALLAYDDTLVRARARLLAKPRHRRGYHLPQLLRVAVPLTVCLLAALLIIFALRSDDDPARSALSYRVGQRAGAVGQRVVAFEARQARTPELRFSDGSIIDLETPASTARVTALDARGARVKLERGAARIFVNPRRITRWRVNAGPFTVHVVGTRFRVAWDGASKRFALLMTRGTVRVEGPIIGERVLRAGQRLDVDLSQRVQSAPVQAAASRAAPTQAAPKQPTPEPASPKQAARPETTATPARRVTAPRATASRRPARRVVAHATSRDEPAPTPAPASAKSAKSDEPKLADSASSPAPSPTSAAPSGSAANSASATQRAFAAIAAGRFCAGNKLLDAPAVAALLARASARRLLALADAARYCGAARRARLAYRALWRRFARSPSAAAAALALARLSLARKPLDAASAAGAARWLDRVDAAHGATAAQQRMAAARRVELFWTRRQRARACALAKQFLSRWPAGSAARYVKQVAVRCSAGTRGKRR